MSRWGVVLVITVVVALSGPVGATAVATARPTDSPAVGTDPSDRDLRPQQSVSGGTNNSSGDLTAGEIPDPDTNRSIQKRLFPAPAPRNTQSVAGREVTVIVEAAGDERIDTSDISQLNATVESRYRSLLQIRLPTDKLRPLADLSWVEHVRRPREPTQTTVSEGVKIVQADEIHRQGNRGQRVRVGILDFGFEPSNPELTDRVAATRSFVSGGDIRGDGGTHGTAVAEIVAETAPDARLHLANFETQPEFGNAVEWLRDQDVDVIVMSAGWIGEREDGRSFVAETVQTAVQDGVVWVNAAGNSGDKHWEGRFSDPDEDGNHNFGGEDEVNGFEGDLQQGETLQIALQWDEWPTTNDYDLYLLDSEHNIVAKSVDRQGTETPEPVEIIETSVPSDGKYGVAVVDHDADGTATLELTTFTQRFEYVVREGSLLVPATARGVTAVGAYDYRSGDIAAYSSSGPTDDGRRGVDVAAPTGVTTSVDSNFAGTSAAAPHVGGVVALMAAANPRLSPQEYEAAIQDTAIDLPPQGTDSLSGNGLVNATAAVSEVGPIAYGRVQHPDGRPATTGVLFLASPQQETLSASSTVDSDGRFSLRLTPNRRTKVIYSQAQNVGEAPDDSVPDFYGISVFNASTAVDVGTRRLPTAHSTRIRVVNRSGAPVENASVEITQVAAGDQVDGVNATYFGSTDATGRVQGVGGTLDLSGTLVVRAEAQNATRSVTTEVNRARNATVRLPLGSEPVAPAVNLSVRPTTGRVDPGGTVTYGIVATGMDAGVGSFDITVSVGEPSTAAIANVSTEIGGHSQTMIAPDQSVARLGASAGDTTETGPDTIGSVTVAGVTPGATELRLAPHSVSDEAGDTYELGTTTNATVSVGSRAPDVGDDGRPAGDPDTDGQYEDVYGDGSVTPGDATVLFTAIFDQDPAVTRNPDRFDFNGDGTLTPGDATVLFEELF